MVDPRPKAANPKKPSIPRPSASVLLISPSNQILLLHRVQTSSSFPSAHVFPGGNLSPSQDGHIPPPEDPARHNDSLAYRIGALRETFEESGMLLAKDGKGELLEVGEEDRDSGRRGVHGEEVRFTEWVGERGGVLDTGKDFCLLRRCGDAD
jgi:8-oxo-dGTP pyrophosphatase MutT (NUDIX family)